MHHGLIIQYELVFDVGCVEVVGCLRREELACWKAVPEGVGQVANRLLSILVSNFQV